MMDEALSTIKKIKSNLSKIYFNKSNKINADFKDDQIEIILDNKNITPKPIYFNFQETETKKSFDQIDYLLKHFDDKNGYVNRKDTEIKSNTEEKITDLLNKNFNTSLENNFPKHMNVKRNLKYEQYKKDILNQYNEILLSETETINLLNIPNILNDIEEDKIVIEKKNERYEKLLNNDENNYRSKSMQTLNVFKKNKDVYVSTINKQNKSSQTNLYELYKLSIRNPSNISELLHKKFLKYRNKKLKKIMDEYGDSLNINEKVILKKNMWVQVVDKNITDNKQTTIIPKSFYKSKKTNTSLFNTLFLTKNISRTLSNKSRTFRTRNRFKNIKTMKFLTSSFSEDEYLIKSIIKKKKEENEAIEENQNLEENYSIIPWQINNKKKNINKASFILILKNIEKYIVQNVYFYEQMIYKNINLNYLEENVNNNIRMFDGENYDAITNPLINYKKKKVIIRIKIKKDFQKIINLHKISKLFYSINHEKSDKDGINFTNNSNCIEDIDLLKKNLIYLSKRKKSKIKKKILICKLKRKIRKKIKNRKDKINAEIKENIRINEEFNNDNIGNENCIENKDVRIKKNDKKEKDRIFDIIVNEESSEDKIKKISTLIIDDVLKQNDNTEKTKILEKDHMEGKKLANILKKKEAFSSIRGNKIKLKRKMKQDYLYKYKDNNEIYKNNMENNLLNTSKRKKYIKNISISKLFQFHYNKLEKIVTSIDTNKFYEDYISASYSNTLDIGSFQNSKGNIAIFSFINPNYPLILYNLNSSVMKIEYSKGNHNLLVAALSSGHIYIYDIRSNDSNPVLKSTTIKNYYENCFEPIYDFTFKNTCTTNNMHENVFYSAHENGYVFQWDIEKELKNKEILFLKNKKNDIYQDLSSVFENKNFVNKPFNSSLTCIDIDDYINHDEDFIINNIEKHNFSDFNEKGTDFNKSKENNIKKKLYESEEHLKKAVNQINNKITNNLEENYIKQNSKEEELLNHYKNITQNIVDKKIKPTHSYYYLGSKNGIIYRCNSCYQKSYLNYYVAHFGSVNKIKINKFDHDIFISAGEDSTVKLWNKFCNKQITTFKSKNSFASINDVLWLPNNSTSFFCCSDDGRIELWDFDFLSKDPLIIFYPNNVESSKIKTLKMFNKNDILLCGDNLANITMMKIKNIFNLELDDYEQKMKLTNCLKYLDTYDYF
ncbi:conserved Plasmodium protein, unknown function [Plasmodium gallinaceum]|uniref:Uncharacterized protein n=1 Tax=Plasmodium gallinaceum TaxID=5849 RepID=A0A1J1H2X9_PLAGA|nr:conserved Plasmodium protein, unknown function [Plasmodium gallinaceum]CRG97694.1 conserved Plasmodium protein, unknown function [Plasmodium gallinaceum]